MAIYLVTFKDFDADYSSGLAVVQINAENPNNIVRDAKLKLLTNILEYDDISIEDFLHDLNIDTDQNLTLNDILTKEFYMFGSESKIEVFEITETTNYIVYSSGGA